MRSQSNNYIVDGISNNDPHVNGPLNSFRLADAVQEFSVETAIPGPDASDRVVISGLAGDDTLATTALAELMLAVKPSS